jgi:peptidoglycan/LPS O-acetylase OafA/YrhL
MQRSGYRVRRDWKTFAMKRVIRLDPPYLASIVIILALQYLSQHVPGYGGEPWSVTVPQVLLHLGYLNTFAGYYWLNPVYWTLAIEFQFYVLVAVALPVIVSEKRMVRWSVIVTALVTGLLIPQEAFIFRHLCVFAIGATAFQLYTKRISSREFAVVLCLLTGGVFVVENLASAVVAMLTALIISFYRGGVPAWLKFLGAISYSLYLLHVPIGGRVVNLGARLPESLVTRSFVLAAAVVSSIVAAYLLYRMVELPSRRWSAALKYRKE